LIVMNHADRQDPLVVMALAKHLGGAVYCLVAREAFDWNQGIRGWLFQRFGCFSVSRGIVDFKSVKTIEKVLTDSASRLIVFPEAEVTGDDATVHNVSRSLMHIVLSAQKELIKAKAPRSLCILPVGVSYRLVTDLERSTNATLNRIARQLNLKHEPGSDVTTRVRTAIGIILQTLAQHYEIVLPEQASHHEQVHLLARHICRRIALSAGVNLEAEQSTEQHLYFLRSATVEGATAHFRRKRRNRVARIDDDTPSRYQQKLRRPLPNIISQMLRDLDRVELLLILQRVLNQPSSPIQTCRVLDCLELEVTGRMRAKGKQRASIYLGELIDVMPHWQAYTANKNSAIDKLCDTVRAGLQSALDRAHEAEKLPLINALRYNLSKQ
ncbi:MAG TPA: 1-acyl-sn-glycerol-3-phosphate acyltransferase, partial [Candidatus Obscuribacterales bacterium]